MQIMPAQPASTAGCLNGPKVPTFRPVCLCKVISLLDRATVERRVIEAIYSSFIVHDLSQRHRQTALPRFPGLFPPRRLVPAQTICKKSPVFEGLSGKVAVHLSIRVVVVALAIASALGQASAQTYYYPPPPPGYYPPSAYYPPPPGYYAPVPPLNADAPSSEPYYGPGTEDQAEQYPPPYPPARRPYGAPDRSPAQAPLYLNAEPVLRPPGYVGDGSMPGDVTGSVHSPRTTGPSPDGATAIAGLPPEDQPEGGPAPELPPQFHRQLVRYGTTEPAGTVIIDTPHTYLYLVLGGGKALRYGVGVGREGFTWTGTERISRMSEWPDWHPPKEMIERQPYLPRFMAGGEGNPLGARALYLGNTVYRIHGTNQPSTIGHFVSSGCIRLTNEDVADLYSRVNVGTRVVVLAGSPAVSASTQGATAR
jgi:lipoprotein-anchoring transpeptidase ErfK/SrfK